MKRTYEKPEMEQYLLCTESFCSMLSTDIEDGVDFDEE